MSTPDPSEPFISSFPENNTVGIVWMLFWVFWGSLVCLYVPLCFCPVPYDGTYVPSKDGEAVKVGVRVQKQADRLAAEEKVNQLLEHMACTAEEQEEGCTPSNKQYAESLLNDNEGDVKKAKEAWKKSPERQLLEMKVEKSDLLDQLNNRIATAAAQNKVSNAAHTARQARRQQRGPI
jgi:hypothetical protein